MSRSTDELVVTGGEAVYVITADEFIPGFPCDPLEHRIEVEIMLERGGPLAFRPPGKNGYCRLGFGILLQVG